MRKIGLWCFDKHRIVISLWVAALIATSVLSGAIGGQSSSDFTLPNTESQRALDVLQAKFPQTASNSSQLVFYSKTGTLAQKRAAVEAVAAAVRGAPTVAKDGVSDPLKGTVSKNGKIAFATITHDSEQPKPKDIKKLIDVAKDGKAGKAAEKAGVEIELGGGPIMYGDQSEGPPLFEFIGIIVAAVLLFAVLGSISAVFMPLLSAILAVGIGVNLITIAMGFASVADFAIILMSLISLGVGIDYGLLLLSRVRNERAKGYDIRTSTGSALDTAGRSVLFAGITVVIALTGMLLLSLSFLNWPALGAAAGVTLTMTAALTLVPAFLGTRLFGNRLKVGDTVNPDQESHFWARYSRIVERNPIKLAVLGLAILLIAASPVIGMRLASTDAGNLNADQTARKAYDLLTTGFGPGFNGPFLAVVKLKSNGSTKADLAAIKRAYEADPGVASVGQPFVNKGGDAATIQITPNSKPQDKKTEVTLKRLRNKVAPPVEQSTGATISLGGFTASNVDFARVLSEKLPLFIGVVVGLSLLLLLIVFRSIAIPIKAAILNMLSIACALGVITWVFQEGNLTSLIGVDATGPIEPFLPVLMFAVVFGLSMDYEVFLVSRMHEEWMRTKDSAYAVRHGMAMTGKVITAAGLIMISVFAGFLLDPNSTTKLFGLGFAAAIFFDAFVIRLLIVPSVMFLLGNRSWWIPKWLDKILPRVSLEPAEEPAPAKK